MPVEHFGPRTLQEGVVVGLPFEAGFEEVRISKLEGPSTVASGMIYRDSKGRVRTELHVNEKDGLLGFFIITEPFRGITHIVLPESKIVLRTGIAPRVQTDLRWMFPGDQVVELGTDTIENLRCRHFRSQMGEQRETVNEIWISDALNTVVMEKAGPVDDQRIWRLRNIRYKEPDSRLFEIPPEYTVCSGESVRTSGR